MNLMAAEMIVGSSEADTPRRHSDTVVSGDVDDSSVPLMPDDEDGGGEGRTLLP